MELQLTKRARLLSEGKAPGPEVSISNDERARLGVLSFREFIERELLLLEAEERGLTVETAELDSAYVEQIETIRSRRTGTGQAEISEEQILEATGQSLEQVRERLGKAILVSKAREAIVNDSAATVSDADVKKFYEERPELFHRADEMHLRQMMVRPKPSPEEASEEQWQMARERINKALARIRAGEKFETVAREVSESRDRFNGGDLGMLPVANSPTALPDFFVKAGDALQVGEMSDVIRSEFGLHIIQLVALQDGADISLEEATPKVKQLLLKREESVLLDAYLQPKMDENVRIFFQLEKSLSSLPSSGGQE
jgi:peptidyl-prolyl cis-trans isomerase C